MKRIEYLLMDPELNQIDIEEIFKKIKVENIKTFELYLKEIWIVYHIIS